MIINAIQLKKILPNNYSTENWVVALNNVMQDFNEDQTAAFIAQIGHESSHLNRLEESLNYSAQALLAVFGKYFGEPPKKSATQYARNQEMIANVVYANRMGNGDTESGEGYKYRGRGILQITGKNNYRACSRWVFTDDRLLDSPELLLDRNNAALSAKWFWVSNHLESITDFLTLTRRINGGTNGYSDRKELYDRALSVLKN